MGILSRRLGMQAMMTAEDPAQPLMPYSALQEQLGLGRSNAGVFINETQAMRIATVQACVRIISEDLSSVSHEILQHLPDGSVVQARNHRLWPIIHDSPNDHMPAKVFWGTLLANELLWGPGYAWIKRDQAARVIKLVPLASSKTAPVKINGVFQYATTQTDTGHVAYVEPENILHFRGLTLDGITSLSPIQTCKDAMGLALAAEQFGALFFANGAAATGIFTHPESLDTETLQNLEKSVQEMASGRNAHKTMILEEGMKWQQVTIPPNDAQFLETRRYQRSEIACLYRVAMHLLQDLARATNNNIEHQSLDHVRYCLRPRAVGIEEEVNAKLLNYPFTMEHNLADLQRGDFASQMDGFQKGANIGIWSIDDMLRKLRENPIGEAAGGNLRVVQGAMIPVTSLLPGAKQPEGDPNAGTTPDGSQPFNRISPAFRNLMRDAVGRILNRSERDADSVRRTFRPVVIALAEAALAMRFGNAQLTAKDLQGVDSILGAIAASAPSWEKSDANGLANRLAGGVYEHFAGGGVSAWPVAPPAIAARQ